MRSPNRVMTKRGDRIEISACSEALDDKALPIEAQEVRGTQTDCPSCRKTRSAETVAI
jgi:hypothetical protein